MSTPISDSEEEHQEALGMGHSSFSFFFFFFTFFPLSLMGSKQWKFNSGVFHSVFHSYISLYLLGNLRKLLLQNEVLTQIGARKKE